MFARALVMAGLGCCATAGQIVFVREFLVLFAGNELCLGILFSCWFVGIALGAWLGGRFARRIGTGRIALFSTAGLLLLLQPALVSLLRSLRGFLEVPSGGLPGLGELLVGGLLLIVPFSLLVGLSFPVVCRFATEDEDRIGIGRVYVMESVGAILGGLVTGVILAGISTPFETMAVTACPLLLGLSWLGWMSRGRWLGALCSLALLGVFAALALGLFQRLDAATAAIRFDDLGTGARRIAWADTPYQHLDLSEREGQYALFADGKVSAVFPDPYRAPPKIHLILTEHPDPKRVLLLGTASMEFLPTALLHPVETLDVVELDPAVLDLTRPRLDPAARSALADPRVRIHPTDGRRFLGESRATWDLIFSDAPDPSTGALNRFYTLEFFDLVRQHLAPGGVFATRISSSANVLGVETASLLCTLRATLRQVFSVVSLLPGEETILLASDSAAALLSDPEALGDRYQQRAVQDPRFRRQHFGMLFESSQVLDLQEQLRVVCGPAAVRTNRDAHPITYLQSILRWSEMTGEGVAAALDFLVSLPGWIWYLAVAVLFTIPLALLGSRKPSNPAQGILLAVGVVGGTGLALELVLTFTYQATFGSLYRELGLIVAAFMLGLVSGGIWINRRLSSRGATRLQLGVVLLALSVFTASLPWLQDAAGSAWSGQALLLLLALLVGAGTGVVFPLASFLLLSAGREPTRAVRTAGTLDAVDHWGAAAGALLTGVVLLPCLGRDLTCWLLALPLLQVGLLHCLVRVRGEC